MPLGIGIPGFPRFRLSLTLAAEIVNYVISTNLTYSYQLRCFLTFMFGDDVARRESGKSWPLPTYVPAAIVPIWSHWSLVRMVVTKFSTEMAGPDPPTLSTSD